MTLSPELAGPLLTDADVHERVEALIGRATQDRCVWLLLVDGDRRQTPVVMPLEDSPLRPDRRLVDRVGAADEEWAVALVGAATGAGLGSLGVFTSTTAGIRRLR